MTPSSETRHPEATRPTTIISTRTTLLVGTWNVRTMFETGKTRQVSTEMTRNNLAILGISEARWIGSGEKRLTTGEVLLFSGHEADDAPHTQGVALMLSKTAQGALIEWAAHGPRIIFGSFRTCKRNINMDIIQCYAPTNDGAEDEKDEFYRRLLAIIQDRPARNLIVVLGDFNAKIGSDNTGYTEVLGRQGLGEMNENGERFADMCATCSLVIGGSYFHHKRIHKATWVSPDHVTENQIDHVCINKKFRRSLQDVRVRRGADVGSDHHLVIAKLKLKLRRHWSQNDTTKRRFNTILLKDAQTRHDFHLSLSNKFQALQDLQEDESLEQKWQGVKEAVVTSCEEVLGHAKRIHKEWITAETLTAIEERRSKKAEINNSRTRYTKNKAQTEYKKASKRVKQKIKADKHCYFDELATEAEEAAHKGNMKTLYATIKRLAGKFSKPERPVKDKRGKPITDVEGQTARWKEYFEELLNRPPPSNPPDIQPAERDLPIDCSIPSKEEIRKAVKQLKSGKSVGPDGIPAEALKADTETIVDMLHPLLVKIWNEEQVPAEWKDGHIIKLPKKGDLSSCSNYRGITLLSIPGKVFNRILLNRMKEAVDAQLRDQQAGFRRDRSCTDQIATLRIILEQSAEWNASLYVNFVDYEKAFDSVDRHALWNLLRHYGVPEKITNIIRNSYEGMSCRVVHGRQLSDSFQVKTGVRQGCLLSPFLFLLAIDWVMKMSTAQRRNGIQWTPWAQLDDLDFADDLALLSSTQQQMQDKTNIIVDNSAKLGLKVHRGKTKVLKLNTTSTASIKLNDEELEEVTSFPYLGSIVDKQGGTDADVKSRIGKARAAFIQLKNIWSSSSLKNCTKLRIFNTTIKPVLLYGAETWRTTVSITKRLQTFINTCLRRIMKIRWFDRMTNQELWQRTGQQPVGEDIQRRRWRWIGHTLRKPASSTTRQALTWNPQGRRKRGRPRNTWRRELEADIKRLGSSWGQIERQAQDRDGWRQFVDGLCPRRANRRR